jgi:hypothetical protein
MGQLSSWTAELPERESLRILTDFAIHHANESNDQVLSGLLADLSICLDTGSDYSQTLSEIINYEVKYETNRSVRELSATRQAIAFFSKSEYVDVGIDKEAVAYDKFVESEKQCRETNEVLDLWGRGRISLLRGVDSVLYQASKNIQRVLGDVPELSSLRLRFGPGATTRTKRRSASAREKLSTTPSCSENLALHVRTVLEEMPGYSNCLSGLPPDDYEFPALVQVVVEPGKLGFVPKNAKTHRTVVTEPSLNGMVQLGIGGFIAERLLAFGVDLKDQSRNQRLAREGSLTGALATLDLSSASDTISRELVFHLLPFDWACFLDRFRTSSVTYKGEYFHLQKFSHG